MTEITSRTGSYGSVALILPLLEHLESEGLDPAAVLEQAGIPAGPLHDARIRYPQGKFEALWTVAIRATGDPALVLRVATRVKPSTLGIIGHLALASESPRSGLELIKGLTPLLWENFECDLEGDERVAFLRFKAGDSPRPSRFTMEYAVGLTVTMSRTLGAARVEPLEARFSHSAPAYAQEYERILQLPVRFAAAEDGVLFPASMLDRSNPSADAALRQLLERHAADQVARILSNPPLPQRIRACILALLPSGRLTAESVAAELSMSSRTLRRRLQEEGTAYHRILDGVRAELAFRHLTRERKGIEEVSFLLGFSDPSAFTKAFRRWTGRTPADLVRTQSRRAQTPTDSGRNRLALRPGRTGSRTRRR